MAISPMVIAAGWCREGPVHDRRWYLQVEVPERILKLTRDPVRFGQVAGFDRIGQSAIISLKRSRRSRMWSIGNSQVDQPSTRSIESRSVDSTRR